MSILKKNLIGVQTLITKIGRHRLNQKDPNYENEKYTMLKTIHGEVMKKLNNPNHKFDNKELSGLMDAVYNNSINSKRVDKHDSTEPLNLEDEFDDDSTESPNLEDDSNKVANIQFPFVPEIKYHGPVFIELGSVPKNISEFSIINSEQRIGFSKKIKDEIIAHNRTTFPAKLKGDFKLPQKVILNVVLESLRNHIQRDTSEEKLLSKRRYIVCESFKIIVSTIKLQKKTVLERYNGYNSDLESVFIILYTLFEKLGLIDNGHIQYKNSSLSFVQAFNYVLAENPKQITEADHFFDEKTVNNFLKEKKHTISNTSVPSMNSQNKVKTPVNRSPYEIHREQPDANEEEVICYPNYYNRDDGKDDSETFKIICDNIEDNIVSKIIEAHNNSKRVDIEFDNVVRKSRDLSIFQVFKFFTEEYDLYLKQRNDVKVFAKIYFHSTCSNKLPFEKIQRKQRSSNKYDFLEKGLAQLRNYPLIVKNEGFKASRLFRSRIEGNRWRLNKNMFRRVFLRSKYGGTRKHTRRHTRRRKRSKRV